ncbi:MAG TPA: hypothetical protein VFH89_03245 [Sphingomicrobium sp.]|nr:hypothetical protein [Sphingomicrobium sp.]
MPHTIAPDVDRLPWLTDDRPPRRNRTGIGALAALALIAMAAVAALAYWFGLNRYEVLSPASSERSGPEAAAPLPEPAPVLPMDREVEPAPMPEVRQAPAPAPVVLRQQQDVRLALQSAPAPRRVVKRPPPAAAAPAAPVPEKQGLQFSNPWESAGVSGKMVRVGTYSTLQQGKRAWSSLAHAFPGMKKLPAVVTDIPSLRDGKVYYRLQIGTTSQAHSEVLCQRLRAIGQSCVVVDVAGARKGSGDERQPVGL